ncbi:MAG: hypothetical protein ABIJ46_03540 [bacterium]
MRSCDSLSIIPRALQVAVGRDHALAAASALCAAGGRGDEFRQDPGVGMVLAGFTLRSHARHLQACLGADWLMAGDEEEAWLRWPLGRAAELGEVAISLTERIVERRPDLERFGEGEIDLGLVGLCRALLSMPWPHVPRPVTLRWTKNDLGWSSPVPGVIACDKMPTVTDVVLPSEFQSGGPVARMLSDQGGELHDQWKKFQMQTRFFWEALGDRSEWPRNPGLTLSAMAMEMLWLVQVLRIWMEKRPAVDSAFGLLEGAVFKDGVYVGFVQAPGGILAHAVEIRDGQLVDFQYITPAEDSLFLMQEIIARQVFAMDQAHLIRQEQEWWLRRLLWTFNLPGLRDNDGIEISWLA